MAETSGTIGTKKTSRKIDFSIVFQWRHFYLAKVPPLPFESTAIAVRKYRYRSPKVPPSRRESVTFDMRLTVKRGATNSQMRYIR
jgi:hypothetical protein